MHNARVRNRRVSSRNVRRVALTLVELVNPSATRDKGTREGICRVIRFYDFRTASVVAALAVQARKTNATTT